MSALPRVVSLNAEATTTSSYDNHPLAAVNDHVVRISVMTKPYHWHRHPDRTRRFSLSRVPSKSSSKVEQYACGKASC